jgi:hypothetical protein
MLLFSKYLFHSGFNAITIWPFIILKNKSLEKDRILIHHEKIHLKQQIEMLWLLFFIWYLVEYMVKIVKFKDPMKAYRNLSFEREAYDNEHNMYYLEKRKFWSFLKYM